MDSQSINPKIAVRPTPQDPKLWKTAQSFQELFMAQFVRDMRASHIENDLLEPAPGKEAFDEMFSEELGRRMAEHDTAGLQRVIYRQLGGTFAPDGARARAAYSPME